MNKYKRLASDTVIFAIGNFTTKLIYFFLMPIYTCSLTTSEFGFADLLNNSLQLLIPIFTLCISDAVFRFALDKDANYTSLLNSGFRVIISSSAIIFIIAMIIYWCNHSIVWLIFGLLYFVESLKCLLAQFTRGIGKVKPYAINGIIAAIVLLGSTYLFLDIFKMGISGYLWAFVCADCAAIIYLLFRVVNKYVSFKSFDRDLLRAMLIFSLPLAPNMASWWFTNISSRYIIAGFMGMSAAGLFSAASKLPALINVLSSIFQLSWQYASVKEYQESSQSEFYSKVFEFYSFMIIISGVILITVIPYLSGIILKGAFYESWKITPLLLYSAIIGCYSIYFGTFYSVIKNNKKTLTTTFIGSIISLVLCFALIPFIGIYGALIASVASYIVIAYLRAVDCRKIVKLDINWFRLIISLIIVLLQSVLMMTELYHSPVILFLPIVLFIYYKDMFGTMISHIGAICHRNA